MKQTNKNDMRQGDVGIRRLDRKPDFTLEETKPTDKRYILAYGEATGHHHSINVLDRPDVELYTAKEQPQTILLYVMDEPVTVEHQEHGKIELNPGWYQVEGQYEYDPEAEARERRVVD